jgi:hypothetical protein
MCLACELDALWYAEWEQQAAGSAGAAGTAGVPPALAEEPRRTEIDGAEAAPQVHTGGEAASAGGTPAVPGKPVPRSRFLCEEAE